MSCSLIYPRHNGQTENDARNAIGTSLQPVVDYRLLYLLNIQSHVNDLRMTIEWHYNDFRHHQ